MSEIGKKNQRQNESPRERPEPVSAVQLPQSLVAAVDAWAEAHHMPRSDAIRQLVELGLKTAPVSTSHHAIKHESFQIEDEAVSQIRALLDPSLPVEERERRIRRLVEGPPEFLEQRIDLPRHKK